MEALPLLAYACDKNDTLTECGTRPMKGLDLPLLRYFRRQCLLVSAHSKLSLNEKTCQKAGAQLVYIELHRLDLLHFVIEECRHLANCSTAKCGCIGLILFRYLVSGRNNMRYKYYRIYFGNNMQSL